ncbi:Abi family protein [Nesterenkonia aerolata]|uniref:Abi family protein n=1 Tax=Nesterenkonia aerolata TaxID=3074079 RepID=A0ABU2DVG2_9MICC|nr:Abi family protein [Nesterenkonia sp. LY-0111]MDR8020503.1 Abi family protein [Nesterenkonia sp. LY-0111]
MSYYRFSGYLWWFYEEHSEDVRPGTTLNDVLKLYDFDATLRTHVMDLAQVIEVWLRGAFANHVANVHGPMGYLSPGIHSHDKAFRRDLASLEETLKRDSPEKFVAAFRSKYGDKYPPIWMATELMSFGLLSKWYDNLREDSLRKAIAMEAGLNQHVLSSFLRMFSVLRNGAAHHARIWNRRTSLRGVHVRRPPALLENALTDADESRIHYVLAIAAYIVQQVDPEGRGVEALRAHLLTAEDHWLGEMDFPEDFEADPLWAPTSR